MGKKNLKKVQGGEGHECEKKKAVDKGSHCSAECPEDREIRDCGGKSIVEEEEIKYKRRVAIAMMNSHLEAAKRFRAEIEKLLQLGPGIDDDWIVGNLIGASVQEFLAEVYSARIE